MEPLTWDEILNKVEELKILCTLSPQELEILRSIKLTTSGKMILDPLQESISLLETFDLEARHALTEQLISSEKYIVKSHQKIVKLCKKFRH